jgi:hypothetical protein
MCRKSLGFLILFFQGGQNIKQLKESAGEGCKVSIYTQGVSFFGDLFALFCKFFLSKSSYA